MAHEFLHLVVNDATVQVVVWTLLQYKLLLSYWVCILVVCYRYGRCYTSEKSRQVGHFFNCKAIHTMYFPTCTKQISCTLCLCYISRSLTDK